MRAALTYRQFYDLGSTHKTGRAFAVVHAKIILIFTAAINPVNAGAVAANAFLQHGLDRFAQRRGLFQRYGIRQPEWVQLRHVQGLIRIDVANPGEEGLVSEQRFELAAAFVQVLVQPLRRKLFAQGFWSQFAEHAFRFVCEPDAPKLACIVEGKVALFATLPAQTKYDPVMGFCLDFTFSHGQVTAHPQMYQEIVIFELENDVLCPARNPQNALTFHFFLEFFRRRGGKRPRPAHIGSDNGATDDIWFNGTCNGFYFREFGHN